MISVAGLAKRFGAARALVGVDLEISSGERVGIYGRNGAGKTTLLKLIAGLYRPDRGTVTVDGKTAVESRARIGYLGHETHLYPRLTVFENLTFFARLYRVPLDSLAALIDSAGVTEKQHAPVHALSRGELQRASIAKALLHDPDILLADEPFAALDEESAGKLPALFLREGRTMLVATHDQDRAAPLVERIVLLEAGRIAGEQ